ncbi:hypothetical protein C1645_803467 [Glomus cerebriforme]|uniref:DNA recombination and repair protein Rad51-like C-terminal domain-containing protein n=1 Tax=Glomus cerebriforme TaxID=658196 RepID=A0A397T8N4_9GLOM|nr:hypothetical protein C1645_803467 [Glomus cerebriforme]
MSTNTPINIRTIESRNGLSSVQNTPPTGPIRQQQLLHVNVPHINPKPNYFHLPFLDNSIKKVYEYHDQQRKRNISKSSSAQLYNQPYIHSGDVIEFYGPSCGGKTTILYHVIVTTIIPKYWTRNEDNENVKIELNGLGKGVLFFDLDGRHDIKRLYTMIMYYLRNRIEEIAKERNSQLEVQLPTPLSSFSSSCPSQLSQEGQGELYNIELPTEQELEMIAKNSLKKLHIFQPNVSIEYLATLISLSEYIKEIQEKEGYEFNYLMIDSISAFYWQDKSEEVGEQAINSGNDVDTDSDDDGGENENSINGIEMDNFEVTSEGGNDPISTPSSPSMNYNGRQSQSRPSINSISNNKSTYNNFQYYIVQALQILLQSTNLIILTTNWVIFGPSENQQQKIISPTNINSKIPQELNYATVLSPYWDSLIKYKFVIAKQLLPQYPDDIIPQMVENDENRKNLLKEPLFFGRLILPGCNERCGEIFSFKISEKGIIYD